MAASIVDCVQFRAESTPTKIAYTFLSEADTPDTLTYEELAERSAAVAATLAATGRPGDRVLLILPPGIDYVVALYACLHAGRIAVPAYPPHPSRLARTLPRLAAICADADASAALTDAQTLPLVEAFRAQVPRLGGLRWLAADAEVETGRPPCAPSPYEVAILQYTSGSTSEPKGVVLGHDNLLHNFEQIRVAFDQTPESQGVFWLPPYHDMGLIGGILQPLYVGYSSVLMSPESFLTRPLRWLEAITRYRATISGGPNFAYELCVRKTIPEEREGLDLSSWTTAFNGAEPVLADTLNRFGAAFAGSGFRKSAFLPCYGLAEATLLVACGATDSEPVVHIVDRKALGTGRIAPGDAPFVSCGSAAGDLEVVIVDPATRTRVADGMVGEVWVSGASVARGYWRQPGHPAFGETLAGEPGRTFLRTGDLGAWVEGGLIISGRVKDLIVIRGRNVYPQDLELAAERSHTAVRAGGTAAFSEDELDGGDPRIAIVCEVEKGHSGVDPEVVGRAVRRAVAEVCEVSVAAVLLIEAGTIPKTSSGKIRRSACRTELAAGRLKCVGESRAAVRSIEGPDRGQVLAASSGARVALIVELIKATAARRGASCGEGEYSLHDLVADSLDAVEIAADLHAALGIEVPLVDVLADVPIEEFAARLVARLEGPPPGAPVTDPTALSPGQSALWLTHLLSPTSSAHNVAVALRLQGRLDPAALARAVAQVGARHGQLRIAVSVRGGRPYAVEAAPPDLLRVDVSEDADTAVARIVHAPFDLERGPLWRVAWLDQPAPVLVLCAHHIIADYTSLNILLDDLERAYRLGTLPALEHDYEELVAHEAARNTPARMAANHSYWRRELADLHVLNLPAPGPRPARPTHLGTQYEVIFPETTTRALRALARAERTTLHTVLLAGLHALLHRWTGQEDVAVGTTVTSRRLSWTRDLVGYCVNPMPVRARPESGRPLVELLREVRDRVIEGVAHELPFPTLVEAVGAGRDAGRMPVFQALLALEKSPGGERGAIIMPWPDRRGRFADLAAEPLLIRPRHVAFDLTFLVEESASGIAAAVQVSHDALDANCAGRIADQWVRLLDGAARAPDETIGRLPLLSPAERAFVVNEVNRTKASMPHQCLHTLVAAQAERTPDADAVIVGTDSLSYRELVARAAKVAHYLRSRGVGPETRVGLYLDRGAEAVVAVLGILGAGGAYVYLDPAYPPDRVKLMVEDAGMSAVVTREGLAGRMPRTPEPIHTLERIMSSAERQTTFPDTGVRVENLAYVIYTSGSTGRPKGVALEHRNAASLIGWAHGEYDGAALRGTLAATSLAFDLSVFELFVPLTCGGTVIVADSALELPHLPARDRVTLINTVPSAMTELVAAGSVPRSVRVVNLAGETLTAALAESVHALGHVERLYNLYGPTEDTTYSTFERVERGTRPTLGRPLSNRAVYVLDRSGQPMPVGVVGEICVGGAGVARGYINRPALTAELFVPSALPDAPGRLYKTGDLGRRLADGRIEYLGRRDRQVKVRGFRIELEEIVAAFVAHPSVTGAAVLPDAEQRLLAWVCVAGGVEPADLRAHVEARLPPYMIPNRIMPVEHLPLTPNGKVDHRALASAVSSEATAARRAPGNTTEAALVEIWQEVLGVKVGVDDDFFALGGHSLLAARAHAMIQDMLGVGLPLGVMFEQPTVERLSKTIGAQTAATLVPRIRAVPRGAKRFDELASDRGTS